jgi:hypothetical protein
LVTEAVVDEAADDGCEIVGAGKEEAVPSEILASLVGKVNVRDGSLGEGFDRRCDEACYDVTGDPLAVASRVRAPDCDCLFRE